MPAKKSINAAAAGILLLALGFVWYAIHGAEAAEAALAAATQNQAALVASLQKTKARAAAHEHDAATLQAELDARRASRAAAAVDVRTASSGRRQPGPSEASLLASDPKLLDLFLRSYRANLSGRFGAAYMKLGLNPAQIQKFEELATANEAELMDLQAAAEAQGLTEDDPGITAMRHATNRKFRAAVAASIDVPIPIDVIAPTRGTPPTQPFVDSLATTMALSSTPLTFAQIGQLTPILESAGMSPPTGPQTSPTTIDWQKVALQATGVLSGPQLQALQVQTSLYQLSGLVKEFYTQQPAVGK